MQILILFLQLSLTSPGSFEELLAKGRNELTAAKYADAARTLNAAVSEGEKAGVDATSLGTAINDLAEVCRRLGKYSEAEPLYKRAIALLRRPPESSRELVMVLNNQGTMYREMGSYFRSAASFDESFAVARKALLQNDPLVGAILNGMAAASSSAMGDLKDAERYLKQSLQIREAVLGPDHLDVGETLNNLAVVWHQRKQYSKAESAFQRALAISEKHLGPEHPDVADTLNNLGVLYYQRRQYDAAERALRRALDIRKAKLPSDHSSIAKTLFNLALVMISVSRSVDAQGLLQQAVAIRTQNSRELSTESVLTLERYAFALRLNGHAYDADMIEARARSMRAELKYVLKR